MPFIHLNGYNGGGKSTLAHTLPCPLLSADSEGRSPIIRGRDTRTYDEWETEGFPELGDNDVVVWSIESYEDMQEFIGYLEEGDHPFVSAVVDSWLVVQEYYRMYLQGTDMTDLDSWQGEGNFDSWSKLKHGMIADLKRLGKLTRAHRAVPISVCVVTPTNRDDEKPRRPDVDGSLARRLVGIFDMQGAAVKTRAEDGESFDYDLLIDIQTVYDEDDFETKCNIPEVSEEFGNVINDPDLDRDIVQVMTKQGAK